MKGRCPRPLDDGCINKLGATNWIYAKPPVGCRLRLAQRQTWSRGATPKLVAGPGIAPGTLGYEPNEILLLHPASIKLEFSELPLQQQLTRRKLAI